MFQGVITSCLTRPFGLLEKACPGDGDGFNLQTRKVFGSRHNIQHDKMNNFEKNLHENLVFFHNYWSSSQEGNLSIFFSPTKNIMALFLT